MCTERSARLRWDEQWQIRRFVELEGSVQVDHLEFSDKPDALVQQGEEVLGIEHTRILRPTGPGRNLRAFESITDQIASRAQTIFETQRKKSIWVQLVFDGRVQLRQSDIATVSLRVAQVVARFVPPPEATWLIEGWKLKLAGFEFPDAVHGMWIENRPHWGQPHWSVSRSCTVPDLSLETVQQAIDQKEAKIDEYRRRCTCCWLVLVVEGFAPSSHWRLDGFPFDHAFTFSFDKVFLYEQFSAFIRELHRQ